jgi:hypothetical protein
MNYFKYSEQHEPNAGHELLFVMKDGTLMQTKGRWTSENIVEMQKFVLRFQQKNSPRGTPVIFFSLSSSSSFLSLSLFFFLYNSTLVFLLPQIATAFLNDGRSGTKAPLVYDGHSLVQMSPVSQNACAPPSELPLYAAALPTSETSPISLK